MASVLGYVRRALAMPPRQAGQRAARLIARQIRGQWMRWRDRRHASYEREAFDNALRQYLTRPEHELLEPHRGILLALANHYVAHRFDLLGSGWVEVVHGMVASGIEGIRFDPAPAQTVDRSGRWLRARINSPNAEEAAHIWTLVDEGHRPLDWQIDFKSGYRWSDRCPSVDIVPGLSPLGADIKLPWELARAQHLPQLALASFLCSSERANALAREFRNQVLDFVAQNPPRFGVNWVCTMDVAIRITNWLVAHDLFRASGVDFDAEFERILTRSTLEHGRHIVSHLEWHERYRSNHYLANIVGLLFVAAYLPPTEETDVWLALAVQELLREIKHQFNEDGSNFEASTSYHRLSAEMAFHGTAMLITLTQERLARLERVRALRLSSGLCLDAPPPLKRSQGGDLRVRFDAAHVDRLHRAAEFTRDLMRADGTVPQFGDNDSGRFLRLPGFYGLPSAEQARSIYRNFADHRGLSADAAWPDEAVDDHRSLLALAEVLLGRADLDPQGRQSSVEGAILRSLTHGTMLAAPCELNRAADTTIGSAEVLRSANAHLASLPPTCRQTYRFEAKAPGLRAGLATYGYPDAGLYVFRSPRLHLVVRCGALHSDGIGSHAHHDQLAIELELDGERCVVDPGSYVYTALPEARQRYRAVGAHFTPRLPYEEPGDLSEGLFVLKDRAKARCLYFGPNGFAGEHNGFSRAVMRVILLLDNAVLIEDGALGAKLERCVVPAPLPVSPKYGCLNR